MAPDSKTVWGSPSAVSWSTIAGILELGDTCATQQTTTTVSDLDCERSGQEIRAPQQKSRKADMTASYKKARKAEVSRDARP